MTQAIQLKVNEGNLVRNLRHAFTRRQTFLAELMQNARRAGASYVAFEYDEDAKCLVVTDDGEGLANPQDILTVGESGWDQDVQETDRPYGMGFLSALYQADHVEIVSKGHRIAFDTQEALGFAPIEVVPVTDEGVTRITLRGVPENPYEHFVEGYAKGYPIRVFWGDREMPRPHALESDLDYIETPMGHLHLFEFNTDIEELRHGTEVFLLYLQGIKVYQSRSIFADDQINILHLDSTQYLGRMPDRDVLVGEDQVVQDARKLIIGLWQEKLCREYPKLEDLQACSEKAYNLLKYWDQLQLLNDRPLLPGNLTRVLAEYPKIKDNRFWTKQFLPIVTRRLVEKGEVSLMHLETEPLEAEEGFQAAMYLWIKEACLVDPKALDKDHWAMPHIQEVTVQDIGMHLEDPSEYLDIFRCDWFQLPVVFSKRIWLDGPLGKIEMKDAFVFSDGYIHKGGQRYRVEEPVIYVPDSEDSGTVVRQVTSFVDENEVYQESDEYRAQARFERFILAHRPGTELELFDRMIQGLYLENYGNLIGETFRVTVEPGSVKTAMEPEKRERMIARAPADLYHFNRDGSGHVYRMDYKRVFSRVYEKLEDTESFARTVLSYYVPVPDETDLMERFLEDCIDPLLQEQHGELMLTGMDVYNWVSQVTGKPLLDGCDPVFSQGRCDWDYSTGWELRAVVEDEYGNCRARQPDETGRPTFWSVYAIDAQGFRQAAVDISNETAGRALLLRMDRGLEPLFTRNED